MKVRNLFLGVVIVFLLTLSACGANSNNNETPATDNNVGENDHVENNVEENDSEENDNDVSDENDGNEENEEVSEEMASEAYEVWVADQGTNEIHIIEGATDEIIETIDFADVGDKPHMLVFDDEHEYAYVANMGSGTVSVIRAEDREVITTVETGEGAHAAIPSPDGERVLTANVPAETLTEIIVDKSNEEFTVERELDLSEVEALQDEDEFPNQSPICLEYTADGGKAYVTLGGGGLVVVDVEDLEVIASFGKSEVGAHGCGTVLSPDGQHMFANSGSTELAEYYVFDTETDELIHTEETGGIDAHGVAFTPNDEHLWMVNRVTDDAAIIDPESFEVVDSVDFVGEAPDLLVFSPDGKYAYITLRGPEPATGTHDMAGDTPGVAIIDVENQSKVDLVELEGDPHGIDLRILHD
ncbi:YncE family protein [Salipaludibacillus daqingensis]|uniref:YncE family protein n=1 Tax=Salipaludibacillus daqingensis TaxID=3041001 RepID=UPI0024742768|nr:hypothetical protein [Salipaludibacillus daqingensis]